MVKILIVEDDASLQRLYLQALAGESYDITVASDGEEAMNLLKQNPPDILVTDMDLPFVSGFQLIRNVRKSELLRHIRILVISASSNVLASMEADLADVVMMKPITVSQLKAMVGRLAGAGAVT